MLLLYNKALENAIHPVHFINEFQLRFPKTILSFPQYIGVKGHKEVRDFAVNSKVQIITGNKYPLLKKTVDKIIEF